MYLSEQVFNMDETGLYWKKKPDWSYIGKDEKLMPGYKAAKNRLTLLFGGNASGNMKFNPLLIYHPENPRTLKNIAKGSLPVVWTSNPKAWAIVQSLSPVCLFVTPWTVAHQVPLSMGFPRQGYWSGLPFPSPGALPGPGIEPTSPALAGAYPTEPLGNPKNLGFTDHIPGLVFSTSLS